MVRAHECGVLPKYEPGTRCPGCHGTNWNIGRLFAECGHCAIPLPIDASNRPASSGIIARGAGRPWHLARRGR